MKTDAAAAVEDAGINVIIPYKNPKALIAYYLGVFSIIPLIGLPLGLAALVLGRSGLRFRQEHPNAGGAVHAWIGIVVGGFFGTLWLLVTIWIVMIVITRR